MSTYRGKRTRYGCTVTVDGRNLPLRTDLVNHSPTGFEWGYGGSGPSQLALAILCWHCASNEQRALNYYQRFKDTVIARIQSSTWFMTSDFIEGELRNLEAHDARSEQWKATA